MYILNPDFKILTLKVGNGYRVQVAGGRLQGTGLQVAGVQVTSCRVQVTGLPLKPGTCNL